MTHDLKKKKKWLQENFKQMVFQEVSQKVQTKYISHTSSIKRIMISYNRNQLVIN